ncbi:multifunctional CCA addition/repair protein [Colwellia sp. 4_MG-2023]|uniref:multifunctional CCA addition/repair protein n=1 Tax=unclassified Colwellia TaxID=196834 RepID=UPI0026E1A0B6|nr:MULTISPECIES: multifunctional CCA addition/repair protein [unclassified Colwellia]MDO6506014.1 multifunctional CCA addition/repair protein [Colwellia sp. 5_MG-2023]MDO6554926.1 multifunctional CCA addition/repair protein [Colwellia sp. 4_MG-2023]
MTTHNNTIPNIPELDIYLVGGAVRDQLLNRPIKDYDYLVVGATVEQMLSLGFHQVGKDFPVFLHPKTKEEYALARTERKQGQGYTGFACYAEPDVTIEQDLLRRDLTVNAMARNACGDIVDPYNGQHDLKNRILRHVSEAFIEDPLRVLRVARFAARYHEFGFTVADETMRLMQKISESGELTSLPAERVWQEMQRSLAEDHPEVFFNVLRDCKALSVLWPDLDKLWGIPNPAKWHPEICSGIHTMMVLQQAVLLTKNNENKTAIRFAALCHDLGKGVTVSELWPSHKGHEKSGLPLVEDIANKLRVPTYYKQLALKVCEHHLHCHKAFQLKASTLLKIFDQLDVWRKPKEFDDFIIACKSDFLGRLNFEDRSYPQAEYLKETMLSALQVNAKTFVEQGLKGIAIKEAMANARLTAIKAVKNKYSLD